MYYKYKNYISITINVITCITVFFSCKFLFAEDSEAPPFRARWPIVNQEIEAGGRGFYTSDKNSEKDEITKQRYGFGVGVNDWLFYELEGEFEKEFDESLKFKAYEIDTRIELTKTKKFNEKPNPIDIGFSLGFSKPYDNNDAHEIESRLLLYKRMGAWRSTGNVIFEKEFKNSDSNGIEMAYAGQLRYRLTTNIQPGFELFGRFGEIGSIAVGNEQHNIGPGVFGFIELKEDVALKYEITWLLGYTNPTPSNTYKWLLELEYKY